MWTHHDGFYSCCRWVENRRKECRYEWSNPDSKIHGTNMGPSWGRQDSGGPHVGPMNFLVSGLSFLTHWALKDVVNSNTCPIKFMSTYEIVFRWMPLNTFDDKTTLVQLMVWCNQVPSHYLNQCWPRSMLPYSITRPQLIKNNTFSPC